MKRRLGRGLAAIIPTDLGDIRPRSYVNIPLYRLDPNPELAESPLNSKTLEEIGERLLRNGADTPLAVQKLTTGQFIVIAGERRWRAAMLAGIETLPAVTRGPNDESRQFEIALLDNLKSDDLDPMEFAATCQKLIAEYNYTHAHLGEALGRDRATISNHVRLLKLPKAIQKHLRAGDISAGHSKALLSLRTTEEQILLSDKIISQRLSVRRVESEVKNILQNTTQPLNQPIELLRQTLQTKIKIQRKASGKGQIIIAFQNELELERLCKHICNAKISKT